MTQHHSTRCITMATRDSTHGDQIEKKSTDRRLGQSHSVERKRQSDTVQDRQIDQREDTRGRAGQKNKDIRMIKRIKKTD